MKKALLISNVTTKFTNFVIPSIEALQNLGYEVHMCANYSNFNDDKSKYNVKMHHIDFIRNPFNIGNIKAYRQLLKLMEEEKFDMVHCNTPIGGLLGRICAKRTNVPKVVYTAHGFHFYKGAPLVNNLVYKNIEKKLAKYTDIIITINQEDYDAAKSFKLRENGKVKQVNGVGIDINNFIIDDFNKEKYREDLGIKQEDIMLISAGDLIKRKNYEVAIKAIKQCNNPKIKYYICGQGPEEKNLKKLINKLELENQVFLLGYRNDIKQLMNSSDIFLFTTKQEGLPRSMMEAMAVGLPCVASKIRGNVDLLEDGKGGYLVSAHDWKSFSERLVIIAEDAELRVNMGITNKSRIQCFDLNEIKKMIKKIYQEVLEEEYES